MICSVPLASTSERRQAGRRAGISVLTAQGEQRRCQRGRRQTSRADARVRTASLLTTNQTASQAFCARSVKTDHVRETNVSSGNLPDGKRCGGRESKSCEHYDRRICRSQEGVSHIQPLRIELRGLPKEQLFRSIGRRGDHIGKIWRM
jgi:hypothetical protein